MDSLSINFTRAADQYTGISTFWIIMWIIAIDDDRQRREKVRRKKRARLAMQQRNPLAGPKPF